MSSVNGLGSSMLNQLAGYQKTNPKASQLDKAGAAKDTQAGAYVQKNKQASEAHIQEGVELSDGAKKLLDELKEKYGNMDFFVSNYSSDEEAEDIMSRGTKDYSVLIEPELLEKMAQDEETKEKYMGIIEDSTNQLSDMKEKIEESGEKVESLGVKIDADGTTRFFAKIKEQNEKYRKQVEADKEAAKEEEKKAEARKERDEQMDKLRGDPANPYGKKESAYEKTTSVYADSVEELIDKIKNIDWSQIEATPVNGAGQKFDFTV